MARLRSFLRAVSKRTRFEREIDEELRFHLESRADDLVGEGLSREEALRRARLEFGSVEACKEDYREARGLRLLDELRQDLLYTFRGLRRSPGFTAVAVATLALGIGANALLFTVVESVLLRRLPYPHSDRLVMVYSVGSFGLATWSDGPIADPDYEELRKLPAFSELAAFTGSEMTLTGGGDPVRLRSGMVTPNLLSLLGVGPTLGRSFQSEEQRVVLLSEALWRGRFLADPTVVGRAIDIDGVSHEVVGVMPEGFNFPPQARLWTPLELMHDRNNSMNRVVGRLADGVTREQALAQVRARLESLRKELPQEGQRESAVVVDLRESMVGKVRPLMLILLGAVACVLLIACANMASLLMARASTRGEEMFVRASLGAGHSRLLRQLLTESASLALMGGALGVGLAYAGLPLVLTLIPAGLLPRIEEVRVSGPVLTFTLSLSVATGLLFGLAPAFFCLRKDVVGTPPSRAGTSRPRRERRVHGALVVAETALVLVLLISAGLLVKSLVKLQSVDPGFRRDRVLAMTLNLSDRAYPTVEKKRAFYARLLERLQALPELHQVSAINLLPFGAAQWQGDFVVEGGDNKPLDLIAGKPAVSEGYFRTLEIPLHRGRTFEARDRDGAPLVAVVSESVARHCWPREDALGKRLSLDDPKKGRWLTVVGVVGDVRQENLAKTPLPMIYVPLQQEAHGFFLGVMAFAARTRTDTATAAAAVRAQVRAEDPELPVQRLDLLDRMLADSLQEPRLRAVLLLGFGFLALLLALVGIYGVMAYEVVRRTAELGIRRALGATTRDVLALVLGRTAALVSVGVALGLLGAGAATRVLHAFLFAVRPLDAFTFVVVSLGLAATALLASAVPAHRAARVEPATALRCE